jgi:hypothetical protein
VGRSSDEDIERVRGASGTDALFAESVALKESVRLHRGHRALQSGKTPDLKAEHASGRRRYGCVLVGDAIEFVKAAGHLEFPEVGRRRASSLSQPVGGPWPTV